MGVGERLAVAQFVAPPDWLGLQGGSAHSGEAMVSLRPPLRATWRAAPRGDGRLSTPVIYSGAAFASGRTSLVAFDPSSGQIRWEDVRRAEGLVVAPAFDPEAGPGGVVVFVEGNGPDDSRLVGLDPAERSARLWETPLGAQSRTAPSIAGGLVFVGTRDRTAMAVHVESGTEAWRVPVDGEVTTSPAVADGVVFLAGEDGQTGRSRLYALDAEDGRVVWSYSPPGISAGVSSPTVADGSLYVGFGDATVRAFDAGSGALRWTQPVRAPFSQLAGLAFADGSVFALDFGGGVYRLDAGTGRPRWDYQFPSLASWGSPLVAGGYVYVGLDDGTIAAIDTVSGHLVWRTRLRQGAIGAFAPQEGLLLAPVIGPRGGVVAFEHAPNGRLLDIHSPSELNLPRALLNLLVGAAVVLALLLGLFRLALPRLARARRRRTGHRGELE
jgi:outer membrane protein assembly factor BamB